MAPRYDARTKGSDLVRDFADNIKDKTILVTGASPGGIGALYAQAIAVASPAMIILASRSQSSIDKTAQAINEANSNVKTKALVVDFGSLKSVREAARQVMDEWSDIPHIDVLVNNAGIMACPFSKTEDGFESQFGVNHLGPFVFTNTIMPKVMRSSSPRVVVVSSDGHRLSPIRWADTNFQDGRVYDKWSSYGQSKTANNLFALSLASKLGGKGLQSFSLHPGTFSTNLGRHVDFSESGGAGKELHDADEKMGNHFSLPGCGPTWCNAEEIIANHIITSFSDDIQGYNGRYFAYCRPADQYKDEVWPWATDPIEADRLWRLSEKLVGQEFLY